jgi:hypothetical protein
MEETQPVGAHSPEDLSPKAEGDNAQMLETLLSEGERLLAEGNKTLALDRFKHATQVDPKSARAWLGLARSNHDVDEAIRALGQVILLDPGNIEARNLRLSLQVGTLREGMNASERAYRESPLQRFGRPLLAAAVLLVLLAAIVMVKDPVMGWLNDRVLAARAPQPPPTLAAVARPPTWTPTATPSPTPTLVPTNTPVVTATPSIVTGRINGTVNARTGPGPVFQAIASLYEPTAVILVARSPDGKYYQVHQANDDHPVWVSVAFVTITNGDPSTLPVVDVPTPTPVPSPRPVYHPPTATPAPVYIFKQIKYQQNPYGPRCDRTLVQGTVWDLGYGNGYVPGTIVAVWINGSPYKTDVAGSHPDSYPAHTGNRAYWEVDFATGQPVSGLVGVVGADGRRLSPQYNFTLTGGDCHNPSSINEIIIDFSH